MTELIPWLAVPIGGVFLIAGLAKTIDGRDFLYHIARLLRRPAPTVHLLALAVVGTECALGVALMVRLWPQWLLPMTVFLLAGLSMVSHWGISSGRVEDCGCYSGLVELSPRWSLGLNALYAVVLTLVWWTGVDSTFASWKVGAVLVAGAAGALLMEFSLRYRRKHRRPLIFLSPFRTGRPWKSDWLGHASGDSLTHGEHLVALLSPNCPKCKLWTEMLNQVHLRPDLPAVIGVFPPANTGSYEETQASPVPFPQVFLPAARIRRLAPGLPYGVLVEDGFIREIWHGAVPAPFIARLRSGE